MFYYFLMAILIPQQHVFISYDSHEIGHHIILIAKVQQLKTLEFLFDPARSAHLVLSQHTYRIQQLLARTSVAVRSTFTRGVLIRTRSTMQCAAPSSQHPT
jgi:hypothetical protein